MANIDVLVQARLEEEADEFGGEERRELVLEKGCEKCRKVVEPMKKCEFVSHAEGSWELNEHAMRRWSVSRTGVLWRGVSEGYVVEPQEGVQAGQADEGGGEREEAKSAESRTTRLREAWAWRTPSSPLKDALL